MATLIEHILTLEAQASEMVTKARTEAELIAKRAENEITTARDQLVAETSATLAALERDTAARRERETSEIETQSRAACAAIDATPASVIERYAEKIVAAFLQG